MTGVVFPQWDRDLFIYLNSKNLPWLDPIMVQLSSYLTWMLVFAAVLAVMWFKDRSQGKVAAFFLMLGVALNSVLNQIVKVIIMRPRPGNDFLLDELIFNQLESAVESYSFFSAHSSTSVCLAFFSALYFRNRPYSVMIFLWAFAVAYSRIYVGKHYPLDVATGILFGFLTGWFAWWCYKQYGVPKESPLKEEREEPLL